jgi:MOSC domain-containing protein YiiM
LEPDSAQVSSVQSSSRLEPQETKPANGSAHIFQINASNGGVPKLPLHEAVVTRLGLAEDRQAHLDIHGGPERALCIYSLERILALQAEGHRIFPGSIGENLTITGLDWEMVAPGTRIRLGEGVLLEVTHYTHPCKNIACSFIDQGFVRVNQKNYPGWSRVYARVLEPGRIQIGDPVVLLGSKS